MGANEDLWGPVGIHGRPWGPYGAPMATHGYPMARQKRRCFGSNTLNAPQVKCGRGCERVASEDKATCLFQPYRSFVNCDQLTVERTGCNETCGKRRTGFNKTSHNCTRFRSANEASHNCTRFRSARIVCDPSNFSTRLRGRLGQWVELWPCRASPKKPAAFSCQW